MMIIQYMDVFAGVCFSRFNFYNVVQTITWKQYMPVLKLLHNDWSIQSYVCWNVFVWVWPFDLDLFTWLVRILSRPLQKWCINTCQPCNILHDGFYRVFFSSDLTFWPCLFDLTIKSFTWKWCMPVFHYLLLSMDVCTGVHFLLIWTFNLYNFWPFFASTFTNSLLSNVLDHQVAACVKTDFLSIFLYILIMFEWQIHKDGLSKLNFRW